MTGRATNPLVDVDRVVEISKVRQIMDANPFERLARLITGPHRLEIRAVRPNLFMAIHADRSRWHSRRGGLFNRRVTVAAINAVIADVVLVAELNWLLALDVLAGVPPRPRNLRGHPQGGQ